MRNALRSSFILSVFIVNYAVAMAETTAKVAMKTQAAIDSGSPPKWWTLAPPDDI
jgi:hypothetical protein